MGVPNLGGGNGGSGTRGGGDIRPKTPEYHSPVYCDSSDTGAVSGGEAAAGNMGGPAVVESGGIQPRYHDVRGGSNGGGIGG